MDLISDHTAQARARMLEQFKGKPLFEGLVNVLAGRAQSVESVLYALATERGIDASVGAQLDLLGRLIGQPRGSYEDETYRLWLRVRRLVNGSSGTFSELIEIFELLSGNDVECDEHHPASLVVRVLDALPFSAAEVVRLLQEAKSGGIRAALEWRESPEGETLQTQGAALLAAANLSFEVWATKSVFTIADTSVLPASGFVVLDSGAANEETLPYEVTSPTQVWTLRPLAFAHLAGSPVSVAPANGLGDGEVDPNVGGKMAGALES